MFSQAKASMPATPSYFAWGCFRYFGWEREPTSRAGHGLDILSAGGDGGIRTLDRALQPYNGLANRRLQPLGHVSSTADMPDAAAGRKRQIVCSHAYKAVVNTVATDCRAWSVDSRGPLRRIRCARVPGDRHIFSREGRLG